MSETHWETKDSFEGWAKSSQFKASHGGNKEDGKPKPPSSMTMLEGPPAPEFYETITTTE